MPGWSILTAFSFPKSGMKQYGYMVSGRKKMCEKYGPNVHYTL